MAAAAATAAAAAAAGTRRHDVTSAGQAGRSTGSQAPRLRAAPRRDGSRALVPVLRGGMGRAQAVTWACPGAPRAPPRRCAPVWLRSRSHKGGNDAAAARRVPAQVGADCEPGGNPRACPSGVKKSNPRVRASTESHFQRAAVRSTPHSSPQTPRQQPSEGSPGSEASGPPVAAPGLLQALSPWRPGLGPPEIATWRALSWVSLGSPAYNRFAFRFLTSNFTPGRKTVQRCTLP